MTGNRSYLPPAPRYSIRTFPSSTKPVYRHSRLLRARREEPRRGPAKRTEKFGCVIFSPGAQRGIVTAKAVTLEGGRGWPGFQWSRIVRLPSKTRQCGHPRSAAKCQRTNPLTRERAAREDGASGSGCM